MIALLQVWQNKKRQIISIATYEIPSAITIVFVYPCWKPEPGRTPQSITGYQNHFSALFSSKTWGQISSLSGPQLSLVYYSPHTALSTITCASDASQPQEFQHSAAESHDRVPRTTVLCGVVGGTQIRPCCDNTYDFLGFPQQPAKPRAHMLWIMSCQRIQSKSLHIAHASKNLGHTGVWWEEPFLLWTNINLTWFYFLLMLSMPSPLWTKYCYLSHATPVHMVWRSAFVSSFPLNPQACYNKCTVTRQPLGSPITTVQAHSALTLLHITCLLSEYGSSPEH